jgi:hypothetical protein
MSHCQQEEEITMHFITTRKVATKNKHSGHASKRYFSRIPNTFITHFLFVQHTNT